MILKKICGKAAQCFLLSTFDAQRRKNYTDIKNNKPEFV